MIENLSKYRPEDMYGLFRRLADEVLSNDSRTDDQMRRFFYASAILVNAVRTSDVGLAIAMKQRSEFLIDVYCPKLLLIGISGLEPDLPEVLAGIQCAGTDVAEVIKMISFELDAATERRSTSPMVEVLCDAAEITRYSAAPKEFERSAKKSGVWGLLEGMFHR